MPEDTAGLPDVQGLGEFVAANQDKDQTATPRDDKGRFASPNQTADDQTQNQNVTQQEANQDWAQFANPDGSLNHAALLKSYKEIQGFATKVSQENKTINEQVNQMQEQFELLRLQQVQPQYAQQQQAPDFDSQFIANPQEAVAGVAEQRARKIFVQTQIESVLQEEHIKNPAEFQERYNYVQQVKSQYPHLTASAPGVKKLFELADRVRQEDVKRQSLRAVQMLFGDDVDLDKLKSLARRDVGNPNNANLAYMPDSTLSNRTGMETGSRNYATEAQTAAAKGDVDSVLDSIFHEKGLRK